jgi:hypothetical protein
MTPTHGNVPSTSMNHRTLFAAAVAILSVAACTDVNAPNLNAPSVDGLSASVGALASTSVGLLSDLRGQKFGQVVFGSSMARDGYRFDVAEGRYVSNFTQLPIDNSNFIGSGLWNGNYNTSLTADALTRAANTSALLSAGQGAGLRGYARTMRAMAYWNVAETRDTLGFPIQTDQAAGTLAPVRCKPAALAAIIALMDSAYTDLNTAGASFIFSLPAGVNTGFGASDIEAVKNLNRAIKAKASLYLGLIGTSIGTPVGGNTAALNAAVTALGQVSVFSTAPANYGAGFYHVFSTGAGDATNPLYVPLGVANIYRLDKSLVDSVEAGDTRFAAKTVAAPGLSAPISGFPAVPSTVAFNVYQSITQKMAVIRMEELVLLRAQANIALNNLAAAKADIDAVRGGAGLPASAAPVGVTATATLTQLLQEKRYSLMWEGMQRAVDLRAYGVLNTTYRPSLAGFNVFQPVLPIPLNEVTARGGTVACS